MVKLSKKSFPVLFISSILLFSSAGFADEVKNGSSELLMGVVPFMSPAALSKRLAPLRGYLSQTLEREVIMELSRDGEQHVKRTDDGRYDMVFTAANHAICAIDSGLYVPGVIPGKLTTAVLIVPSTSPFNSIDELKGRVVATPQKKGTLAVMAPKFFQENGFTKSEMPKLVSYASQNAAFLAVQNGDVDAAFLAKFAIRKLLSKNASASIKEILHTKPFPGISLILSSRISVTERDAIINTMTNLGKNNQGKEVLKQISFPPFKRSSLVEFDTIRHYFEKSD